MRASSTKAERLRHIVVCPGFEAEDGVGIGVVRGQHDDRRLEAVLAQDAHGLAAVNVRKPDIHDDEIDLARFGGLHALAAAFDRDRLEFLVQGQLLGKRVAQFCIVLDNENLTRIRHPSDPHNPRSRANSRGPGFLAAILPRRFVRSRTFAGKRASGTWSIRPVRSDGRRFPSCA